MLQVTLLGARGTGIEQLAARLRAARPDIRLTIVDEHQPEATMAVACGPVLLMGLDGGPQDDAGRDAAGIDQRLRQQLGRTGTAFRVIYGQGPERLLNALAALDETSGGSDSTRPWVWSCDNCSDPQCERRLLSDLLSQRAA